MDRNGVAWCKEKQEEIAAYLREGQDQFGWREKVAAALMAVRQPWFSLTDPFGSIVSEAIRLAELQEQAAPVP
jgi:hypothetical protein